MLVVNTPNFQNEFVKGYHTKHLFNRTGRYYVVGCLHFALCSKIYIYSLIVISVSDHVSVCQEIVSRMRFFQKKLITGHHIIL